MITRTQKEILWNFGMWKLWCNALGRANRLKLPVGPILARINHRRNKTLALMLQDKIDRATRKGNESWEML
jgi:hypothetical protein